MAEQIDRRRAEQLQVCGAQADAGGHGPGKLELEAQLICAERWPHFGQVNQAEEVIALWEYKILLQYSVAVEHIARVG
ncbi:hypothetical protein D3C78_963550 [compost metagenome]